MNGLDSSETHPVLDAWRTQLEHAPKNPWLLNLLLKQWQRVLARATYFYNQLASLPRRNRRALQRALATSLIGAAMLLALSSAPIVHAGAAINVDGTTCTLDNAIASANTDSAVGGCTTGYAGADTLNLTADITVPVSLTQNVTSTIILQGNNHFISGNNNYSLFYVSSTGDFTIDHVTLKDASATNGAAILNYGTVTVQNSTLTGNYASNDGGAIGNYQGTVTITNSTLSNNSARNEGGAIENYDSPSYSKIQNSMLTGNFAGLGGAVFNYYGYAKISDSTISGSTVGGGLAVYKGGFHLAHDTITANYSRGFGGGINCYYGTVYMINTTVSNNSTYYDVGGVDLDNCLDNNIISSTISGNHGIGNGGNGGIDVDGTNMNIINSTVSGNTSVNAYAGIGLDDNNGYNGDLYLSNSTVTGNSSGSGKGGGIAVYHNSNLYLYRNIIAGNTTNYAGSQVYVSTLMMAKKHAQRKAEIQAKQKMRPKHTWKRQAGSPPKNANSPHRFKMGVKNKGAHRQPPHAPFLNVVTSNDFNLFGQSSQTNAQAFSGFTPGATDLTATSDGTNPTTLGGILNTTLGNNGGPTLTHALVVGSPAIDKAPNTECTSKPVSNIDQRGAARNVNINNGSPTNLCDIGAFELQSTTAVDVSAVTARLGTAGHIVTHWRTLSESQIAGFDVYRQVESRSGKVKWKQINSALLQAHHAGSVQGGKYHFKDKAIKENTTYRYKILVHYLDGHTVWTNVVTVETP